MRLGLCGEQFQIMRHWSDDSLCRGLHQEMFYPPLLKEDRTAPESQYYALGKFVCENCPVIEECREAGQDEEYGLWGGQSPKDRRLNRLEFNKTYLPLQHVVELPLDDKQPLDVAAVRESIRHMLKRRKRKSKLPT